MKVFLTVGTQLPFGRLIKIVDELLDCRNDLECVGQIGDERYQPRNFCAFSELKHSEFELYFNNADVIIAHAGMGTIISALLKAKPVLICPRRGALGEHRNDHQYNSFKEFKKLDGCYGFESKDELGKLLEGELVAPNTNNSARDSFCLKLKQYLV